MPGGPVFALGRPPCWARSIEWPLTAAGGGGSRVALLPRNSQTPNAAIGRRSTVSTSGARRLRRLRIAPPVSGLLFIGWLLVQRAHDPEAEQREDHERDHGEDVDSIKCGDERGKAREHGDQPERRPQRNSSAHQ